MDRHDRVRRHPRWPGCFARPFVRHDTTEQNMRLLWSYLEKFGRPLAFYTDKASILPDGGEAQTGRAGSRTRILWRCRRRRLDAPCRSWELPGSRRTPRTGRKRASGEEFRDPAQDRLVKGLRVAGVKTIEQANQYLEETLSGVVGTGVDGGGSSLRRRSSTAGQEPPFGGFFEPMWKRGRCGTTTSIPLDAELYQIRRQAVVRRIAQSQCTGGEKARRFHRRPVR